MVGLERTVLPLNAEADFGLVAKSVTLSFLVSFGMVKALANLFAGRFSDRVERGTTALEKMKKPNSALTTYLPPLQYLIIRKILS